MVQTRSAFSLIEILVVVAMVAMLATVGVSSWRGMQEKSLLARGLNQVRQMGLATCQYAADNDGTLPGSAHDGNSWVAGLLPYFGLSVSSSVDEIKKVYRSPADPNKTRLYSYAINDFLLPGPAGAPHLNYSRQSKVPYLSETVLFTETQKTYTGSDHFHFVYGVAASAVKSAAAVDRYQNGGLYVFADGHVEWLRWNEVQARLAAPGNRFLNPVGNP